MQGFIVILLYLSAAAAAAYAARGETRRPGWREPALFLAAAAVAAHAAWLVATIVTRGGFTLAVADSASLLGWMLAAAGLLALFAPGYRVVSAAAFGLAALLAAGTGSLPQPRLSAGHGWPLAAHALLAMGAAGMFTLGAVLVALLSFQDARLRSRRPAGALSMLPPVESLERGLFTVIAAGFAALTVAIVLGLLFVTDLFAQHLVHKTTLALVAWLIFAVLLAGRWRFGWRGRKAARYTLTGFAVLALAYFGSKIVLEVVLGRHWG